MLNTSNILNSDYGRSDLTYKMSLHEVIFNPRDMSLCEMRLNPCEMRCSPHGMHLTQLVKTLFHVFQFFSEVQTDLTWAISHIM